MFSELLIEGMPHDKAGEEFKDFIKNILEILDFKIVHFQLSKTEKVVLFRFRGDKRLYINKTFKFKNILFSLKRFTRPILQAIRAIEDHFQEVRKAGLRSPRMESLASINLSNIPEETTEEQVFEIMSDFGDIAKIKIYEKGAKKNKKRLKCRLATIDFQNIQGAVAAFYMDKINLSGTMVKIKFYLTPKKVQSWLQKNGGNVKRTQSRENQQNQEVDYNLNQSCIETPLNPLNQPSTLHNWNNEYSLNRSQNWTNNYESTNRNLLHLHYLRRALRRKPKIGFIRLRKNLNIEKIDCEINPKNIRLNSPLLPREYHDNPLSEEVNFSMHRYN